MSASDTNGRHDHVFLGATHDRNQRRTMIVVAITAVTMLIEIGAGWAYGSMALLADGFHMSTHAGALLVAALAYRYARQHQHDPAYTFGTGKVGDLAAFASAIVLGVVALLIAADALWRLGNPVSIQFDQAILIGIIGLIVNLVSAALLHEGHDHPDHPHAGHGHPAQAHHDDHAHDDHDHDHHQLAGSGHSHGHADHHARDHNLRAAYLHVFADAVTSVLAIAALIAGRYWHWVWLDPAAGILGALLIASWSISLMRASSRVLLDAIPDPTMAQAVRERIEREGGRVTDLHLWRIGPGHSAAIVSVASPAPGEPERYKQALADIGGLSHVTIEVSTIHAA